MRTLVYATAALLVVGVVVVLGAGITYAADTPKQGSFYGNDTFSDYLPGVGYFKGSLAGQYGYSWKNGIEGDFAGSKNRAPGTVCGTGASGLAFGPSPRPGC